MRTFGPNAYVPGNLIRFLVTGTVEPGTLALHTAAGEEVPASVRDIGGMSVFMTEDDVAANVELVLTYSYRCNGLGSDVPPETREVRYELSTFAAEPIEKMAPALILSEQGRMFLGEGTAEHVFKRFAVYSGINPSVAGHLLIQDVSINSHPASIGANGEVAFAANCERTGPPSFDSCGGLGWLSPGRHTVLLRTHLIGETVQPDAVELEFDLECGAAACIAEGEEPPPPVIHDDAEVGVSGSGASSDDASARSGSSGCSAAPGHRSPAAAWIALLALLALSKRYTPRSQSSVSIRASSCADG